VTVGAASQCITTDAATVYLRITESTSASETAATTFEGLVVGNKVDVYGKADRQESACVRAENVQKYVTGP
jgi:hypothetical protein